VQPFLEVFRSVLEKLDGEKISYFIVGSLASTVYGEPRLTRDMDLVVDVSAADVSKFMRLFQQPEFYCPPPEILSDEIINRGQFNLLHVSSGLKVDIIVRKNTPFDQSRVLGRRKLELWEDFETYFASPEDVIIKKLEFYREGGSEKHLRDIKGILANSKVDQEYISQWTKTLRLEEEWKLASR
jgi:hypothetical protein